MAKLINRIGPLWPSLICLLIFIAIISQCHGPTTIAIVPERRSILPTTRKPGGPGPERVICVITTRDYLLSSQIEESGFGLYGYVLLARKPQNQSEFNRYLRLFKSFYSSLYPSRDYLVRWREKKALNITYWPLLDEARSRIISAKEKGEFAVNNYDYPRSRLMLHRIRGLYAPGPFVVAYNTPLGVPNDRFRVRRQEVLILDLSNVHEDLFDDVFQLYQSKVAEGAEAWMKRFDIEYIRNQFRSLLKDQADNIIYLAKFLKN